MRSWLVALLLAFVGCAADSDPSESGQADVVGHTAAHDWDLNDVTMLMPFPRTADMSRLLRPDSAGTKGALLPASWLAKVPNEANDHFVVDVEQTQALGGLRVIALRLDPCFSERCRPVVRMSWQPIVAGTAVDAALHSFYELSEPDFRALAARLFALRTPSDVAGKPLGPHPTIVRQGFGGAYWREVEKALLDACGEASLFRMTVMQLGGRTNVWTFRGFEKTGPMTIARTDSTVQTIAVHAQPPFQFDGGLFKTHIAEDDRMEPAGQPELNSFLRSTSVPLAKPFLRKVLDTAQFLETPSETSTSETIDCASCHIAQAARKWVNKSSPTITPSAGGFVMPEGASFDLANQSPLANLTNQLRALGYYGDKPVMSQRVINESAVVAATMRKQY